MFCSKCGTEVANGERFCPSCGTPAGAAAPAPRAPKAGGSFFAKIGNNVKNLGVSSSMYVGYLLTLVLSWLFVNMPIFTIKSDGLMSFDGASYSLGFSQMAGTGGFGVPEIYKTYGVEATWGWIGPMTIVICLLVNLALIAAIVFAVLPIFMGKKVGPAVTLIGLITSAASLFFVILNYIFVALGVGDKMGEGTTAFSWPSMAGWMYMFLAIGAILLSIFVIAGGKKRR